MGLALVAVLLPSLATAHELSPAAQRGRQIYRDGTSPRQSAIEARVGASRTPLPGSAARCAACHGRDGRGRPEAGVLPANIRWEHLTAPYGHRHPMGRKHGPFTEASLREVLIRGVDPAGNPLNEAMPIYRMQEEDLADLVAYLKVLEVDVDPGVQPEVVRIGTVVPAQGWSAEVGQAVREMLSARFRATNTAGGINGRRIELVAASFDPSLQSPIDAARRLAEGGDVFALVSPYAVGQGAEMAALAEELQIPVVGPFALESPDPRAISDYTFLVYSGARAQLLALVDYAAGELAAESPRMALVGRDDVASRDLRSAVEEQARKLGWKPNVRFVPSSADPSRAAAGLRKAGVASLLLLDPRSARAWLEAAAALEWYPDVLVPGPIAGRDFLAPLPAFLGRILLAYPTVPGDQTAQGLAQLQALLAQRGLGLRQRAPQVFALVAAQVLEEGLKTAGRELSRAKLLLALEKLDGFRTGLAPPIRYGPNRRIGAFGAYVVAMDPATGELAPPSDWIVPR